MYSVKKEMLSQLLESVSSLTDCYAQGEMDFSEKTCQWLKKVENTMAKLRLPEGAHMAALRNKIISAPDIALKNNNVHLRSQIRKYQDATASEAIGEAERTVNNVISEAKEILEFYQKKLAEAITAAMLVDIIPLSSGKSQESWLRSILAVLKENQATKPTMMYLSASLTMVDRLYIVDNIMDKIVSDEPKIEDA